MSQRRNKDVRGLASSSSSSSFSVKNSSLSTSRITRPSSRPPPSSSILHTQSDRSNESTNVAYTSSVSPNTTREVKAETIFGSLEEDGGLYDDISNEKVSLSAEKKLEGDVDGMGDSSRRSQWIVLAVASGTCAAFNGVFAKLTTSDLTASIASSLASLLRIPASSSFFEAIVRIVFFSLNLIFNGIMWTLFTKALAKGTSTTQVSILNTSSNFVITALLGLVVFSESLPPLWWAGATLLVAGSVIIGAREEQDKSETITPEDKFVDELELGETEEEEAKRRAMIDSEDLLDFRE